MARKPMVTRTITTTEVTVLCMDVVTVEPFNKTVTLPREYKNDKAILKAVAGLLENDTTKVVHIVDKKVVETLYGMPEQVFIDNAVKLDPETRKELD